MISLVDDGYEKMENAISINHPPMHPICQRLNGSYCQPEVPIRQKVGAKRPLTNRTVEVRFRSPSNDNCSIRFLHVKK